MKSFNVGKNVFIVSYLILEIIKFLPKREVSENKKKNYI